MHRRRTCTGLFVLAISGVLLPAAGSAADKVKDADAAKLGGAYEVVQDEQGVEVRQGGALVAKYWNLSESRPIVWPLIGVGGNQLTRGYPMRDATPDERADHIHHRSFWFTHDEVNGINFWGETEGHGSVMPDGDAKARGGDTAVIEADHRWVGPDGKPVLSDSWHLTFDDDGRRRWIDCVFQLQATEGDVHFGDTKEGTFAIRVAGTMKVDAKKGGRIITAEGATDGDAWGVKSPWVDYHGPVGDRTEGIAIMNHPSSFHYPNRWHVRTYGLFAANPFGAKHFTGGKETGGYTLPKGQSLTLAYRVLLHAGDHQEGGVEEVWNDYKDQPIPAAAKQ